MKHILLTLALIYIGFVSWGQYAPAAEKPGSTALYKDSSIFINWAKQCTIYRGWKNITQKDSGFTSIGDSNSCIGRAGENGIISLGDSGIAICQFNQPIIDGEGWDFAVFENTFDDRFLELATVEVSSDGWRYFRFPCHSLTDTVNQTSPFGYTEPENINNLAGKYRYGFGTPFDIGNIPDYKDLNKNNIRFVKIIDVVGSLNPAFATYDTAMRKINDPWPTPFPSGGFDFDAIGVIHEQPKSGIDNISSNMFIKGPNPIKESQKLEILLSETINYKVEIYDALGRLFKQMNNAQTIMDSDLPSGLFYINIFGKTFFSVYKGLKL